MAQRQVVIPQSAIARVLGLANRVAARRGALGQSVAPARPDAQTLARATELAISRTLRLGILLASALVAVGLLLLLASLYAGNAHPTLTTVLAPAGVGGQVPRSPAEVLAAAARFDPNGLVGLGLLVLIVTPLASVLLSGIQFWLERDYTFVAIVLSVLAIVAGSLLWGAGR